MLGVLLAAIGLGNVDPEVLHQTLEVLLQEILPGHLEDPQGHLEDGLNALEQEDVENSESLK